jgi:hypothetical protein
VTEPLQDVSRARLAQYEPLLGCVSGPQEGAMACTSSILAS